MDKKYAEALRVLERANLDIVNIMNEADYKTNENAILFHSLENWARASTSAIADIKYFQRPTTEGWLRESDNGKFFIESNDGKKSYDLSCGDSLELYQEGEWHVGRVEHRTTEIGKGYYFYGCDSRPFLHQGMKVRKRVTFD